MVKIHRILCLVLGLAALGWGVPAAQSDGPLVKPAGGGVKTAAVPTPTPVPTPTGPFPQVRVEARIIEWQITNSLDFDFAVQYQRDANAGGILGNADLTLPAAPALDSAARIFLNNMDTGNGNIDAVIEMLKGAGKVRVLSQPSIILTSRQVDPTKATAPPAIPYNTSSGINPVIGPTPRAADLAPPRTPDAPWPAGSARLTNATQIPYALNQYVSYSMAEVTQYRDVGVTMDVLVQCVKENLVFLDMRVTASDVNGFISVARDASNNPQTVPVIDSRSIQNRLVIPNRTIFIAGLIKTTREQERRSGIPWLSELPGLRWLLSNRSTEKVESELIFLIKPEIMASHHSTGNYLEQGGLR